MSFDGRTNAAAMTVPFQVYIAVQQQLAPDKPLKMLIISSAPKIGLVDHKPPPTAARHEHRWGTNPLRERRVLEGRTWAVGLQNHA
jgi:hypothetical protein